MKISWIGPLALAANLTAADVTVYVASDAPAPVSPAESIARTMLRGAGVTVVWHDGTPRSEASSSFLIRVALADRTTPGRDPDSLAVSYPYAGATRGITIFYDRIRRRTERDPALERALLAHVLVHEITHVLQAIDRHSETGVMKAHWNRADYAAMAHQPLPFTDEDVALIRQGLLLRSNQKSLAIRSDHEGVPAGKP